MSVADRQEILRETASELRDAAVVLTAGHTGRELAAAEADEHLERAEQNLGALAHDHMSAVQQVRAALRAGSRVDADLLAAAQACVQLTRDVDAEIGERLQDMVITGPDGEVMFDGSDPSTYTIISSPADVRAVFAAAIAEHAADAGPADDRARDDAPQPTPGAPPTARAIDPGVLETRRLAAANQGRPPSAAVRHGDGAASTPPDSARFERDRPGLQRALGGDLER